MSFDSYGIHIGFLYFRYYGIILMAGALAAAYLAQKLLEAQGQDGNLAWDGLIWALVAGVIGARLYHVFTPSLSTGITVGYYLTHPLDIIDMRNGGLGIPGAVAGGAFGLYLFARRRKVDLRMLLDVTAPGLALAQAIGRWGNFVNQELYGPPTDLPWGIYIRPENRLPGYTQFDRFQPLFLYESLWNLANAGLLYWLWRTRRQQLLPGDLFLIYLVTYPVGRFFLEFLRLDYVPVLGINFNQALMALIAVVSGASLYWRHHRRQAASPLE
jgi:phosphatidylglycerol:prolipoprotein diacylglycerol transferase